MFVNGRWAFAASAVQSCRSAELSGENEKLRRELERTTKILEASAETFANPPKPPKSAKLVQCTVQGSAGRGFA